MINIDAIPQNAGWLHTVHKSKKTNKKNKLKGQILANIEKKEVK